MSFEHPNRNNESMRDVELDIMSRPPEHNTTNLDLDRMNLMLDILGHPEQSFRVIHVTGTNGKAPPRAWPKHLPCVRHAYRPVHLTALGEGQRAYRHRRPAAFR